MAKNRGKPKHKATPKDGQPKSIVLPDSYKTQYPVWKFSSFDWSGAWGTAAFSGRDLLKHFEKHLAHFETMTWAQIEQAAGGKADGHGTNSHSIPRDKFTKDARDRLAAIKVFSDTLFSLRLEATVRVYGIREGNCLKIIWYDPFHSKPDIRAAYKW